MSLNLRNLSLAVAVTCVAATAPAATRITYEINGAARAVAWTPTAFPMTVTVDRRLIEKFPDAQAAISNGMAAWSLPGTAIEFAALATGDVTAGNDGRNVVTLTEDLFRNQGALALTTYTFDESGRFLDADIQLDAVLLNGGYNVSQTVQHEFGHLLGFDHSAVISSVMYPYVGRGSTTASLDLDDSISATTAYATNDPSTLGATLQGRLVGDTGGVFAAQVVAVNAHGQPVASALTNAEGEFRLLGIPAGRYRIYAEPLDGPVGFRDLNGVWRAAKGAPFPTHFMPGEVLEVDGAKVYGNLILHTAGPAQLNPRWIGAMAAGSDNVSLSSTPVTVRAGQPVTIAVGGDGFTSGMTEFDVLNPAFQRVSDYRWSGNYVSASYLVKGEARPGSAVILVRSGNAQATLTGGLKIVAGDASDRRRAVR